MRKSIKRSLIFFSLLIVIMLSSVLVLPSMLFADTTLNAIPGTNWNTFNEDPTQFTFDLTGIDISKIISANLKIWANNVEVFTNDVSFNGSNVGHLTLGDFIDWDGNSLSEFDVSSSLIGGINTVVVTPDVTSDDWLRVYQSELVIEVGGNEPAATPYVEPVWVRTQEMTCKRVWINEDNKFQFSFIYPYRDNNWVKIYDMSGKEVFIIDMPYDNPNIIVDLPDGMYTVKTFNDQTEPIQTFIIGKP